MQPTQHMSMNMGQAPGGIDSSSHQGTHANNALFPNDIPHTSMQADSLTSALSLLTPDLLQAHPQMHQSFAQLAASQPRGSASLLSQVQNQLQPAAQPLLPQQPRGPNSISHHQPLDQQTHQQRSHSRQQQHRPQSQQQQQQQPQSHHQSHPLPGQQAQHQQQPLHHLNSQQHAPNSQQQQPQQQQQQPNLAQLLAANPNALNTQSSLLQQHASILSDSRSSVSSFSRSLHEAKQATPSDRADIRNVVSILERASKTLVSELEQGVVKLRALASSQAFNNMTGLFKGSVGANQLGQDGGGGQDLFGALNGFGMPGPGLQQQQHNAGGLPFDLGLAFQQNPQARGIFGTGNANVPGGAFSSSFNNDGRSPGTSPQGANAAQNSPFVSALLAQYLSQPTDPASRQGALSLFQSLANGSNNGSLPNSMQGLEALLNQGLPQQQQSRVGMPGMDGGKANQAAAPLANSAPLTNAAALAALTSLGITPAMLEALGLGSVAQQMLEAPVDSDAKQDGSSKLVGPSVSPARRDDSPDLDPSDPSSEPARKKRKQVRGKAISSSPHVNADASSSKLPPHVIGVDAKSPAVAPSGQPVRTQSISSKPAITARQIDRNAVSIPNMPGSAASSDSSRKIPTLGVGLRQEGDKRYRNRKLLRDLREHLYRWLGTDEFRKLRNTYKVAEWVPNPNLTEEEKQILASLPPGAVAQPPITTHIFHVDFTSRDFYRTNQSLIDAIVAEGSKKVEAKPEAYAIVPGTIDRDHLEDVAKDLMDSARSGFRMSLRTGLQAEKEDKEKHEKYRGVERAKTKCRNREIGAGRLRHAIPKQLLIPGAYSDDAASDEDLHGLTKSEWKRQRLRKLRIAKGWEAVTPKWRNKHLTRAYHKADIVSKSKQMARWRRDDPVDLPIPIKLYGKLLPKQLFDPDWLAEHRKELEDEPYCIRINDNDIEGWDESHHPLGEDTSDEMEWSDAKESSMRGRGLIGSSGRERGSTTQSPVPGPSGSSSAARTDAAVGDDSKPGSATPAPASTTKESPDAGNVAAVGATTEDVLSKKPPPVDGNAGSEGSGTSSVSGSSRSGHPDAGDSGGSDSDSDVSIAPPPVSASEDDKVKADPSKSPSTEAGATNKASSTEPSAAAHGASPSDS
ncbi:uncharacterized protein UHOD_05439 [Ustilago sp. UG-2017b]|nr:uncharacterized protein UHOD_05439 [Ustilago sp. UG-2017b]